MHGIEFIAQARLRNEFNVDLFFKT